MGLTVTEALTRLSLNQEHIVAGRAGLEKVIHRVNFLEVPDIVQWLDGGELLLTTGFALKDNPDLQSQLLHQLSAKNVAALAIKSGRYLTPIPQIMLKLANDLGFPLVELPADLPLSRVMAPIYEILLNQQLDQLKQAEEIHRQFLEIILKGQGITQIGSTLAQLVKSPVVMFDTRFQILFQSFSGLEDEFPWKDIFEALKRRIIAKYSRTNGTDILKMTIFHHKQWELVIFPVMGSQFPLGYIVIIRTDHNLAAQENMACEQAALVAALEMTKQNAVFEAERKSKGELLDELLYGHIVSLEAVKRRARLLNFNPEADLAVFVVSWQGLVRFNEECLIKETENLFKDFPGGILCQIRTNQLIGFVGPALSTELLRKLLAELASRLSSALNQQVTLGVGRAYSSLENTPLSYEEARVAALIGSSALGPGSVVYFEELGSLRCLFEIKDSAQIRIFHEETVGKLKEYDRKNSTELLKTLEAYFQYGCNLRQTSRELFIHRNTLGYRLSKIEEITNKKLNSHNDVFDLQLAVRLDKFIS